MKGKKENQEGFKTMTSAIDSNSNSNINIPSRAINIGRLTGISSPANKESSEEETLALTISEDGDEIRSETTEPEQLVVSERIHNIGNIQIGACHESASHISVAQGSALLVVCSVVISGILSVLPNYKEVFSTERSVVLMANFVDLQQLPPSFYFLLLTTNAFLVCMAIIFLVAWSLLDRGWIAFYLRAFLLFVVATVFICYALLLQPLILYLHISIGGDHISGFWLLWLYSICTILIFGTLVLIVFIVKRNVPRYLKSFHSHDT